MSLREAAELACNALQDVAVVGWSQSVDPKRWAVQVAAPLKAELLKDQLEVRDATAMLELAAKMRANDSDMIARSDNLFRETHGKLMAVEKEWEALKTAIKVSGYRSVTLGGELRIIPRE